VLAWVEGELSRAFEPSERVEGESERAFEGPERAASELRENGAARDSHAAARVENVLARRRARAARENKADAGRDNAAAHLSVPLVPSAFVTASTTQLPAGAIFAQDFRIDRPLRAGGMGAVYIATQISTGTRRAIKLMLPSYAASDSARRRFEQEARIGAHIPSEHVVQVIAAGFDEETQSPWLAMELLEGEELADRVRRTGPLPLDEARLLFTQLGHAMGAAHRARVVHRDLKPENIFLALPRTSGFAPFTVKVLDFGIAKVTSEVISQNTGTMGTPIWMAPEQTGPGHEIAPATDVWALGLIAYFALTGRCFWRSASDTHASMQMLLREILIDPIPPLRDRASEQGVLEFLPEGFDRWFALCVRRETGERFANADDAIAALDRVLGSDSANAGLRLAADGVADGPAGVRRGSKALWIAGAVGGLALVAGVGALLPGRGGSAARPPEPLGDPRSAISAGALWWGDLVLAQSTSADEPCDASGFAVVITPKQLLAGDPPKALFPLGGDHTAGAPAQYKRLGVTDFFLVPLASAIGASPARRLLVIADAATPYRMLSEVLYTASHAGITRWDFAVVRDGHPRSFAVYPPKGPEANGVAMKVITLADTFEAYVGKQGDAGTTTWKPLAAHCEHEGTMVAPMHDAAQLEECLANALQKLGKIVPQVSAPPDLPFGRVLLAVDRVRAGFGDVELAMAEKVEREKAGP
jgi:serine/threonine protein kinase